VEGVHRYGGDTRIKKFMLSEEQYSEKRKKKLQSGAVRVARERHFIGRTEKDQLREGGKVGTCEH